MRSKLNRKQLVIKKIEHRHNKFKFIENNTDMNERDRKRIYGDNTKPVPILKRDNINNPVTRNRLRGGTISSDELNELTTDIPRLIDYGVYEKKNDVDYDVIICISSYNRFKKIVRLIKQFYIQPTKYKFKIILLNDGSDDNKYKIIEKRFNEIIYLKKEINGGKSNYWKSVNEIWDVAKTYKSHTLLQLDDDFILCDNFLNILLDKFFEIKEINNSYMVFAFHLYEFDKISKTNKNWFDENKMMVDGGMLFDTQFMKKIDYKLDNIEHRVSNRNGSSSLTWVRIKELIIQFKMKVYRFKYSLVWHSGNDDSKLHSLLRRSKRIYTKNFIDKEKIKKYEQYD